MAISHPYCFSLLIYMYATPIKHGINRYCNLYQFTYIAQVNRMKEEISTMAIIKDRGSRS